MTRRGLAQRDTQACLIVINPNDLPGAGVAIHKTDLQGGARLRLQDRTQVVKTVISQYDVIVIGPVSLFQQDDIHGHMALSGHPQVVVVGARDVSFDPISSVQLGNAG